jgi:hypothetical protein
MKVGQLIELLESMPEDADVRIAHQPAYPFECGIGAVAAIGPDDFTPDEFEDVNENGSEVIVYLGEGEQFGYLPGVVSRALGWK